MLHPAGRTLFGLQTPPTGIGCSLTSAPTRTAGIGWGRPFPTAVRGITTAPNPCWSTNAQKLAVKERTQAAYGISR